MHIELEKQLHASRSLPFGQRGKGNGGKLGVGARDDDIRGEEDVRAVSTDIPIPNVKEVDEDGDRALSAEIELIRRTNMDIRVHMDLDSQTDTSVYDESTPVVRPHVNTDTEYKQPDNRTYPDMDNQTHLDTDKRMQEDFFGMKKELMTTCSALETLQKIIKEKNKSSINLKKQYNHEKEILLNKNNSILDDLRIIHNEKNVLVRQFEESLSELKIAKYDSNVLRKERFVYLRVLCM
jgi:hypothetical protein